MKKIILKTATILLILAGIIVACEEEKEIRHDIVGTWIKETNYPDATGDTIMFTNDFRVYEYFKFYEDEDYRIGYRLKADSILISVDSFAEQSFRYSINGNKLTMYRFTYPFSLISVERENVTFIRSQTN
jgi:hypothetical protein